MKRYIAPLLIVAVLLFTTCASAIEISPPQLVVEGEKGDFKTQTIEIYNDREEPITVNMSVMGIPNYWLPQSTFTLNPYQRKHITFGITVTGSVNGMINYEYDGNSVSQTVEVTSEKSVTIFPPQPTGGKVMYVISPSKTQGTGFISVTETGNQYAINLAKGMPWGRVNLSKKDYGEAMMLMMWDDGEMSYHFFNISKAKQVDTGEEEEKELTIDFGEGKIEKGNSKIITLTKGDDPVKGDFVITYPNGDQTLKDTNDYGQISMTFSQTGTWIFTARHENSTVSKEVKIGGGDVSIDVNERVTVGEEITIELGRDEANYNITTPDDAIVEGDTDDGEIAYIPEMAGEYEIEIGSNSKTFYAYHQPTISLQTERGQQMYSSLTKGKRYYLTVEDAYTDDTIEEDFSVYIQSFGYQEEIEVDDGEATWIPQKTGSITMEIDKNDDIYMNEGSKSLTIHGATGGGTNWRNVGLVIIILCIIFAALLLKYGERLPIIGKYFKGKDDSEQIYKKD